MLKAFLLALFSLSISSVYAQEKESPINESTSEISQTEAPSFKSANIVLEYNSGFGQLGLDAAMTEKLALVARYGAHDLLSSKQQEWKGDAPLMAKLHAYSLGLDYFVSSHTFTDSLILGARAYQLKTSLSQGYRIKYGNNILKDSDTLTSAQGLISYKWFSDSAHINGGPGLAYDLGQKSLGLHLSIGVTF